MKKIFILSTFLFISLNTFSQTSKISLNSLKTRTSEVSQSSTDFNLEDTNKNIQLALSNPDYLVTPGDIYSLTYAAGSTGISYKILVDSSYRIRVSNLAVLDAKNKTYVQLKKQVEEIVSKNYPLSGVQFILTSPAQFKVIVNGAVLNSSEQKAWALSRLSEIIKSAPTNEFSSSRFVTIKSADGSSKTYDLFKTIRYGDFSQDPYIKPGDVITIHKTEKKVSISGAVVFPETYELSKDENLKELIENFAGGFSPTADTTRIELTRKISNSVKTGEKFYLSQNQVDSNYELKNLDEIFIESFQNLKPRFYLEGAVHETHVEANIEESDAPETSTKLSIQYEEGAFYDFIIRKNEKIWFSSISDIENAYIMRGEEIIPINIKMILDDSNYYSNITIQQNDILRIPFKQFFITVAGSVNNPGRYPYIPDRNYEYYIGLAGGFNKNQNANRSVKIVDMNGNKLKKTDTITPETTITAKTNSFMYYFNQTAPIITTLATLITTGLSVYAAFGR